MPLRHLSVLIALSLSLQIACGSDDAASGDSKNPTENNKNTSDVDMSSSTSMSDMGAEKKDMVVADVDMNVDGLDMFQGVDMQMELDMSGDVDMATEPDMSTSGSCDGKQLQGYVYNDKNRNSLSLSAQVLKDQADAPFADLEVRLYSAFSPNDMPDKTTTNSDGTFCFDGLRDGTYIIDAYPSSGNWTISTSSQAKRLPKAIQEGRVDVLVFGDSIPVTYETNGRPVEDPNGTQLLFPNVLKEKLEQMVPDGSTNVSVDNVARSGTNSNQWLPTGNFYKTLLEPKLQEADVVVFTLGGNDLLDFYNNLGPVNFGNIAEVNRRFTMEVSQIILRVKTIVDGLRVSNPDIDIVWQLYPNYATTQKWKDLIDGQAPGTSDLISAALASELRRVRKEMAHYKGLLLWDIFGATFNENISGLLADLLHVNEPGHRRYARELFYVMGGVEIVGGKVLIEQRTALPGKTLQTPMEKIHNIGLYEEK